MCDTPERSWNFLRLSCEKNTLPARAIIGLDDVCAGTVAGSRRTLQSKCIDGKIERLWVEVKQPRKRIAEAIQVSGELALVRHLRVVATC